jgi:hypothetical protein
MSDALRVCLFGDVIHARKTPSTAGLRGIIDSGERMLQRTTGGSPAVPQPVTVTAPDIASPAAAGAPLASAPVASAPAARTELIDRRRPESPRWPLVAVPALVLAVVAGVVFVKSRGGSGETAPASAPAQAEAPAAATQSAQTSAAGTSTSAATTAAVAPPAGAAPPAGGELPATDAAARAAEAKGTESVRRALAGAVEATWQFYLKEVTKEYGDEISDLKADFDVVVDQAGQFSSVRPGRLSEEATFDENASTALQNAAPIKVGAARRSGGWPMRVRFVGQTVRVQSR